MNSTEWIMLGVGVVIGLLGWLLRGWQSSFITQARCLEVRGTCATGRAATEHIVTEIRADLKNLTEQYKITNEKLGHIVEGLSQLSDKYVTFDRLKDILEKRG